MLLKATPLVEEAIFADLPGRCVYVYIYITYRHIYTPVRTYMYTFIHTYVY